MKGQFQKAANARLIRAVSWTVTAALVSLPLTASAHDIILSQGFATGEFICNNSANWQEVMSVKLAAQPHSHTCAITAAADTLNSEGTSGDLLYLFTVSADELNPLTNGAAERTIESRNQPNVNDPDVWPVATTRGVRIFAGSTEHVFRFQCRKNSSADPALKVLDGSMTVVCVQ